VNRRKDRIGKSWRRVPLEVFHSNTFAAGSKLNHLLCCIEDRGEAPSKSKGKKTRDVSSEPDRKPTKKSRK